MSGMFGGSMRSSADTLPPRTFSLPFHSSEIQTMYEAKDNITVRMVREIGVYGALSVAGTGWFIDPTTVVTAAHTDKGGSLNYVTIAVDSSNTGVPYISVPVEVLYIDRGKDLAFYRVKPTSQRQVSALTQIQVIPVASSWSEGEPVVIEGYPSLRFKSYSEGVLGAVGTTSHIEGYAVETGLSTIPVTKGFSGSPVLNQKGESVGVLVAANSDTWEGVIIPFYVLKEAYRVLDRVDAR